MFGTSLRKNRQMKRIVNPARKTLKKSPAMPSTWETASGTETAVLSAPSCRFFPIPVSPSQESSLEERSWSIVCGSSCRKSRTEPTIGTRKRSPIRTTPMAVPSTVTVAARPRDQPVFLITKRTGNSKTSPRKIPTKTIRNVSPIATNAPRTPIAAETIRIVRIGISSSRFSTGPAMRGA